MCASAVSKIELSKLSTAEASDLPEPSSSVVRQSRPEDGLWLIAIVFGYVFGLFLIFVIVWFIWYGTSLKRKYLSAAKPAPLTASTHNTHSSSGEASPHCYAPQYDYSASSSLNWPISNSFGLNHDAAPALRRTNPVFGDELLTNSQFRIINYEANNHNSNDSTSFVQMYHKQRL